MTHPDPSHTVHDIESLERLYGTPGEAALIKVAHHLTPEYRRWIMASRFCVMTTVGPQGTDGSPRGDDGPVVQEMDSRTLLLPDWRGNNRLDSLRNIVADGRISLMFMVPGSANVIRVNGSAILSTDPSLTSRFDRDGTLPRTVIVITIGEIYSQCARALIRARLWTAGDESAGLPSVGEILAAMKAGFDGSAYDDEWPRRAAGSMW
jgi:PPOX class probable FMN-dependent enzyme